ncbi:ATP-binding cassette domain-containing protein [Propionicicella superfundia]|uniref:ABC transporter ATP-binding protein/permease n=1 Tax=Propionicicella superfundia TaxID=348582 RepID=UPI00042649EF|nr:ABC transporter ATP-binding protein/permease [Propionicicella superfundia]
MALLTVQGVTHRYAGADVPALADVSLEIERGEFVAIVGPSGSGKSTLLNILGLLEAPTSGSYAIDGRSTTDMTEAESDVVRSRVFGFVFQNAHVLGDDTVASNVELGLRVQGVPEIERGSRAREAIEAVGLDVPLRQRARLLSGGEQQRLAIARALATRPDVVFADEPTGNLDSANGSTVLALLRDFHARGGTVVLVTHDRDIAASADRQLLIRDGELVEDVSRRAPDVPREAEASEASGAPVDRTPRRRGRPGRYEEALRSIAVKPMRFAWLLTAFVLGVAGLVVAQGLSESAAAQVNQRLTAAALDSLTADLPTSVEVWRPGDLTLDTLQQRTLALPRVEEASWVAGVAPADVTITRLSPAEQEPADALGLTAASPALFDLVGARVRPAGAAALLNNESVSPAVILATGAARALGIEPTDTPVNLTIWVNGVRVQVIGFADFPDEDQVTSPYSQTVFISRTGMALVGDRPIAVQLRARTEPGFPATVASALPLQLAPSNPGSVTVRTVADLLGLRIGVAADLAAFVGGLAVIVLILACVAGGVAMYLSVVARTSEIALRRAIGSSRGDVFGMFLFESLITGLLGGALGAVAGQALTVAVTAGLRWTPVLSQWAGPLGLVAGVACGLLSGAFPAIAASRKSPAQAMRE